MPRDSITTRLLLVLALLVSTGVRAEHEADHRYSIRGYLVDGQQKPIVGAVVSAQISGQRTSGRTDERGYYVLNMHLHDSDIGREIEIRAGEAVGRVRMQAERGNQHSARVHWVSFVDGQLREDDLGHFQMPGWGWALLGVTGIVVLVAGGVRLQKASMRRRKATERVNAADGRPSKRRKGKKRRR